MKELRICLITTFYPPYHPGGCGLHVYHLANLLAGDGHQVEVICSGDAHAYKIEDRRPGDYPHHPGVKVHRIESGAGKFDPLFTYLFGGSPFSRRKIEGILKKGFDVIHYHNISLFGGISALGMGEGVKLFTLHTYWLFCPTHYLWKLKREPCEKRECLSCLLAYRRPPQLWRYTSLRDKMLRRVDSLLMPCRYMVERHRREGFTGRIDSLPYFVSPGPEEENGPLEEEFGKFRPFFLFVARLESYKGPQVAVSAFKKKRGEAKLLIVGTGSMESTLRKSAGDDPRIRFLKYVEPEKLDWLYRNATALLAPSVWPEMGNQTVLQAESFGTPVIASAGGCLPELIEDGKSGIVFRNEEELIGAMDKMEDESERARFVEPSLALYRERYTPAVYLANYYRLIDEILKFHE